MSKFEIGQTYYTSSNCDHNCIVTVTVVSRTAKTIKATDKHGELLTLRCGMNDEGAEVVMPWGRYSMAPSISSDDTKVLRPDWEKVAA